MAASIHRDSNLVYYDFPSMFSAYGIIEGRAIESITKIGIRLKDPSKIPALSVKSGAPTKKASTNNLEDQFLCIVPKTHQEGDRTVLDKVTIFSKQGRPLETTFIISRDDSNQSHMREKYIKVLQSQLTRDQKAEKLVELLRQNPIEEPTLPGEHFLDFQNDLANQSVELRQFLDSWKVGQRYHPKPNYLFCVG